MKASPGLPRQAGLFFFATEILPSLASLSDVQLHIADAPLGAGPKSIITTGSIDSGLALRAPRNDGGCCVTQGELNPESWKNPPPRASPHGFRLTA
jgi:hypothetical protein